MVLTRVLGYFSRDHVSFVRSVLPVAVDLIVLQLMFASYSQI